ncbi:mitochondrial ribosome recycling factor 1 [Megachile rotundata]|uniref:mitochondrial ribosome recycling factor 1 n=1 Tax=Megachile rotundata TaxID=143995 RepID=UPI000614BC1C|nr:PREDICTED: ribosome-recycling factor, mitochondrial [Megachile rotundata]
MNLLKPQFFKLTNYFIKHGRSLYTLQSYRSVLTSDELRSIFINSCYNSFNLSIIHKFSTTNILSKQKSKVKSRNQVHVDVNALAEVIKLERMMSQFDETIEKFKENLINYASTRANISAIENLPITFEDNEYKLMELVEIKKKPNMIVLDASAFPQIIPDILELLTKSHMNLNPQQEGTVIYVPIPKVTKEYRESLVKNAKKYFVTCKTAISDIRNEYSKKLQRADRVPENLKHNGEIYINTVQHEYVDKANQLLKQKEKELLGAS